ncbi:MAG: LPS-assembly protein LptD [Magnetococcales bacterium]|nr:LPS-assembly protein LptD [Magnetococcales bacterium]
MALGIWLALAAAPLPAAEPEPDAVPAQPVEIEADRLERDWERGTIRASGDVQVTQGEELELRSKDAVYHEGASEVEALGEVRLRVGRDRFTAERAHFNVVTSQGSLEGAAMDLDGPGGKGKAKKVIRRSPQRYALEGAEFTNCDCDPPPWTLRGDEIDIDLERNEATGRNVSLELGGVPILYSPWWSQPARKERQSGFLVPRPRFTGSAGMELDVPYYWNIAPDEDATFALHPTSQRGLLTRLQYRAIGAHRESYLETENIHDTSQDAYRGLTVFEHRQDAAGWWLGARGERSFSRDYINDFHQNIVPDGTRVMESRASAGRMWNRGDGGYSLLSTGTQWFQDLDAANDHRTVQRLPYLQMADVSPLGGEESPWKLKSAASLENYYQLAGDATQRLDLFPVLEHRQSAPGGTLTARAGLRETMWMSQGDAPQLGGNADNALDRQASLLSLRWDGRAEREYALEGENAPYRSVRHTVIPTVQLVNNAVTGQGLAPDYDAAQSELNSFSIFAENQFAGVDRISQGEWVSYGVTNHLVGRGEDGMPRRLGSLSLGQRWAPEGSREFQEDHPFSDLVGRGEWHFTDVWSVAGATRYDPYGDSVRTAEGAVGINTPRGDKAVFGYIFRRGVDEDAVVNADVVLTEGWHWRQNASYSLSSEALKSWRTGLVYKHDCWSLELSGGEQLSARTSDHGGGWVGFILTFQGLGGYGVNT